MKPYVKKLSVQGRRIYDSYVSAIRKRARNMIAEGMSDLDFSNDEYFHIKGYCSGLTYAFATYEEYKPLEDALFEEYRKAVKNYERKWEENNSWEF